MLPKVIAIDGPAGSGKTVIGKRVADALGYLYLDTGAFYRALTWLALTSGVDPRDGPALARLAESAEIRVERPGDAEDRLYTVLVDGQDVTRALTQPMVAQRVSIVAAHPEVRAVLLPLQRQVAQQGKVVMAGRDIGTVVFPFAELKLYLKAPLPVRVARRIEQLEALGTRPDPALVAAEMAERDRIDQSRAAAPLKPAPDAILLDTAALTIEEEVAMILDLITKRSKRA
ncbi:MAG TPA: (d)CMP kinase [Chloroflexota bacterium]|nr:(d)CMP kinase [Chloroflexota bacterium]